MGVNSVGEGSRKGRKKRRKERKDGFRIGFEALVLVHSKCAGSVSAVPPVKVPVRASVTPHKRRYTYYNRMFKPIAYHLPKPLTVSLV
ncbi:unnamed protein product [Pieris brassicae]|uniref:Uncharacterized protein n=1 Tax=Pieris brassicae TaxID=7116 RepID=A0A9P0XG41_PIEBR|nr:unnamed protein product [Pieris brassicae]